MFYFRCKSLRQLQIQLLRSVEVMIRFAFPELRIEGRCRGLLLRLRCHLSSLLVGSLGSRNVQSLSRSGRTEARF